jgi:PPOX class probable FMN-dependent enzyme
MAIAPEHEQVQERAGLQPMAPADRARIMANAVTTIDDLYAINGETHPSIANKHTSYLTPLLVEYLEKSPFCVLATTNSDGTVDASPRGDAPQAAHILDYKTIALADRPGNKRVDSLRNIVSHPQVGLLFVVPGIEEAVRLNGRATVTTDPELLARLTMQGKVPKLAIVIEVEEVYIHCARALLRGKLWQAESWPDPDDVPTLQAIWNEQKHLPPPDESEGKRNEEYRTRLY